MPELSLERKSNVKHWARSILTKHVISSCKELPLRVLQPWKSIHWKLLGSCICTKSINTQILADIDVGRSNIIEELELRVCVEDKRCSKFFFTPRYHTQKPSINFIAICVLIYKLRTSINCQLIRNIIMRTNIYKMIMVNIACLLPTGMTSIEARNAEPAGEDLVIRVQMQDCRRGFIVHEPRSKRCILWEELYISRQTNLRKHALGHDDQTRDEKHNLLHGNCGSVLTPCPRL